MPRRPMNACERGNWIDTEGHIESADEGRTYLLSVAQDEREPLEDYCAGATRDGVPCHIRPLPKIRAFRAEIRGVVNIAREIALTQKCIRTRKKTATNTAIQKLPTPTKTPIYTKTKNNHTTRTRSHQKSPQNTATITSSFS